MRGAAGRWGGRRRTTRVPAPEQPRRVGAVPFRDARLGKLPLGEDAVARHFGDDGRCRDDGEQGVGLRGDGERDGGEEGLELGLVVGCGADRVDVALRDARAVSRLRTLDVTRDC